MHNATASPGPTHTGSGCSLDQPGEASDVRSALDALIAANVLGADRDQLHTLISVAARVRGWLDSFDVDCTRRARALTTSGAAESPESMFGGAGRRSSDDAARITSRTQALDEFGQPDIQPCSGAASASDQGVDARAHHGAATEVDSFESALREGRVSTGHIDAIAQATHRLDANARATFATHLEQLLASALVETVATFTRRCRALAQRIVAAQARSDADELDRQRASSTIKR